MSTHTFEENDRGLDPAHGPEIDTSTISLEDFEGVFGILELDCVTTAATVPMRHRRDGR
jgi:hypothetical protein